MNEYYFPMIKGGLGDKFMILSNILNHRNLYNHESILYLISDDLNRSFISNVNHLNDLLNFFNFKKPNFDLKIKFLVKKEWLLDDYHNANFKNKNFSDITNSLLRNGKYWPIDFKNNKKNKICWILYTDNTLREKIIDSTNLKKFNILIKNFKYENEQLNSFNYSENVKILSESKILLASEGVWTHLSRAMNVFTIAYSLNRDWIKEINNQGHYCSSNFEECLFKLKEKCTELMK